ncbi:MAG: hypothetical protein HLUCCA01_08480 [Bacteroidetes bacterium HLUCCA01]|nr:MAG: hypothetical protein HLUCCA01_08480 [Bacteroidetes bacterium HLUCCA01]
MTSNQLSSLAHFLQSRPTPLHEDVEGYVYPVYGDVKYLKFAIASIESLRRYDAHRPVALACEPQHEALLRRLDIRHLVDDIVFLEPEHRSITGFKHNVHRYARYDRTLFLDADMIFCRKPDDLWTALRAYRFTATGSLSSDPFFGGPKGLGVLKDILLQRRRTTLSRFGLTYLNRVQSGVMYVRDRELAQQVCTKAAWFLDNMHLTHFQSRLKEKGRTEESCEWSLAMAMSDLDVPVFPWINGHTSAQMDYIADLTTHDHNFEQVSCRLYTSPLVHALRGIRAVELRRVLTRLLGIFPGKDEYMEVTPVLLHFGWLHEKQPFYRFADEVWLRILSDEQHVTRKVLDEDAVLVPAVG